MKRFEGKTALVTGAASGIGRATVLRLVAEGAEVTAVDVDEEGLAGLRADLGEFDAAVQTRRCDVSAADDVAATVAAAVERFGRLDVLCNVAGILRFDNTHELPLEAWNRVLAVNLTGTFLMCQTALPHLLATKGAIVNLSSTAALGAHPWTAAYSASKGGVYSLTLCLALEYGKQGLRVNCLCPGAIKTPMRKAFQLPEGADPKLLDWIMPLTGFGKPEECAAAIAFLASEEATHIQGTALRIDGGMLM